jgi:hypothetical protein
MRNAVVASVGVVIVAVALGFKVEGQVQPVPGPGSGVVTVTGRVEVVDGMVRSSQNGDWKVTLANIPDVRVVSTPSVVRAPLPFLKQGARYKVTWPDGTIDTVSVGQLGSAGWIFDDGGGRDRWVNLDIARSVEAAK